jgi:hypothetical protein
MSKTPAFIGPFEKQENGPVRVKTGKPGYQQGPNGSFNATITNTISDELLAKIHQELKEIQEYLAPNETYSTQYRFGGTGQDTITVNHPFNSILSSLKSGQVGIWFAPAAYMNDPEDFDSHPPDMILGQSYTPALIPFPKKQITDVFICGINDDDGNPPIGSIYFQLY